MTISNRTIQKLLQFASDGIDENSPTTQCDFYSIGKQKAYEEMLDYLIKYFGRGE